MNFSKQNPNHISNVSNVTKPQRHSEKFQKSSILFTQLGLVLALFIVHMAFEFTTTKEVTVLNKYTPDEPEAFITTIPDIIIERPKKAVVQSQKVTTALTPPDVVPDDTDLTSQILDFPPDDDTPTVTIDDLPNIPEEPTTDDPIPFVALEEAPIFPGCEGLTKKEAKKCFTKEISKFVNKRFDTGLAEELNITGKQRISTIFTIDKTGNVINILVKAPHKRLEKEAIRIINKLPKMTPGKQHLKPVKVKYALPIVFKVY